MGDAAIKMIPFLAPAWLATPLIYFVTAVAFGFRNHNLLMNNRIHLIGIGGTGLSAIARLLHESGYIVTGSDRELSPLAEELIRDGVKDHDWARA